MTHNFASIHDLMEAREPFDFTSGQAVLSLEPTATDEWVVKDRGERIGRIRREVRDRATYYVGYIEDEPDTVNWLSDEIDVLVSRMITLR